MELKMEAFQSDDEFVNVKSRAVTRQYPDRNREVLPRHTAKPTTGTLTSYNFQNIYSQSPHLDSQLTIQKLYGTYLSKKGASVPKF